MNDNSKLIGWLVSYQDEERGAFHEIRSGRTIISSKQNGEDSKTIAINEKSITSPHSAVLASKKHVVKIQDIFSKNGTFVKKSGGNKEEKMHGTITLNHGDWIRFGNKTKFQVCLIDIPKR